MRISQVRLFLSLALAALFSCACASHSRRQGAEISASVDPRESLPALPGYDYREFTTAITALSAHQIPEEERHAPCLEEASAYMRDTRTMLINIRVGSKANVSEEGILAGILSKPTLFKTFAKCMIDVSANTDIKVVVPSQYSALKVVIKLVANPQGTPPTVSPASGTKAWVNTNIFGEKSSELSIADVVLLDEARGASYVIIGTPTWLATVIDAVGQRRLSFPRPTEASPLYAASWAKSLARLVLTPSISDFNRLYECEEDSEDSKAICGLIRNNKRTISTNIKNGLATTTFSIELPSEDEANRLQTGLNASPPLITTPQPLFREKLRVSREGKTVRWSSTVRADKLPSLFRECIGTNQCAY